MNQFWDSLSIRYKITAVIVLTILLVTVTTLPAVVFLIRSSLLAQQQKHVTSARNLAVKLFTDYQGRVADYAKLFSNDRELKDALFYHTELAGEREHPLRAATRLYGSFGLDSVEVGDSLGRVVAVAEAPEVHDEDRSSDPVISSALDGRSAAGIELAGLDFFLIKASEPIFFNENQLIGTITAGITLNENLLLKIKELSGTDIVLLDAGKRVITATLPKAGEVVQAALRQEVLPVAGTDYLAGDFPLTDVTGREIGTAVIIQKNLLPEIILKAHATLLLLFFFILVVSLAVLFVTMRRITLPIVRLREGAERIGSGDFGHRIAASSADEIGELSGEFNKMAGNLERLRSVEDKLAKSERLAAIGEFAAGIAHEINNPLANVIGIAKLVQKNPLDPGTREDMESIITNASRGARIVQDLLSYSRQSPPHMVKTDLTVLIDKAVLVTLTDCGTKAISIRKNIDSDLPEICIDPFQISQVLQNLLQNAMQAIDAAGTITIAASPFEDGMIEITFADTGCGIPDENRDKIFYPFFTTKRNGEGTGLGLAICYGIVRNHGGEITVESGKGMGSRFRIRLPAGTECYG